MLQSLVLLFACASSLAGQDQALEIVRRSVALDERNSKLAREYTFLERVEEREVDSQGKIKSRKSRTYDISFLYGAPYRRLIERDDRPLPPQEEEKQRVKLEKNIANWKEESDAQRTKRLEEQEKRRDRGRAFLAEIPEAFHFRLLGEENLDGKDVYVIEASPKPGYRPRESNARFFPKVRATLWIEKAEFRWVRVEAETLATISFGLFLARLGPGSRMTFEQTRVNDEVWMPTQIRFQASARLALVKKFNGEIEITHKNFRKFQSSSEVTYPPEVEESRP